MQVLSVNLDHRLTFNNHMSAVAWSCNYHAWAIHHIRHLLMLDLAQMHACSLILSRIDYCNSAARHSIQHHSEAPASPEQCGAYHSTSASTVRRQLAASDCTGCLLNSASTTSWPCWRSRLSRRNLCSIWASTPRCAPAHATLDRHLSHCCACHFDGHHSPGDRSALPNLWLETHCHMLR